MQQPQISDLIGNPDYYLLGFDHQDAVFVHMTRECYTRSIFFDGRIVTSNDNAIRVPVEHLRSAISQFDASAPRIGWIFHMAHTGSTLLARALDQTGKNLVIREPATLRALGVEARASGSDSAAWTSKLHISLKMLDRRYAEQESVIVKANVPVNAIIPDLLARCTHAKAILLHFGLDDYLIAILRSTNHRKWVEHIFAEMRLDQLPENFQIAPLSTAEKAAALWLFQIRIYTETLAENPDIRSLDANVLFDEPHACLAATSDYFDCPMDEQDAIRIVSGELFSTYSKNPNAPFDNTHRKARVVQTRAAVADEMTIARRWVESRLSKTALPARLAQPLCGENSLLF